MCVWKAALFRIFRIKSYGKCMPTAQDYRDLKDSSLISDSKRKSSIRRALVRVKGNA